MDHHYTVDVDWLGNRGEGTSGYRSYGRDVVVRVGGKPELAGSADVPFRGSADRWNPEELLLAALAQCHLLSYLHSAVKHGIVVVDYADSATGTMEQVGDGGRFTSVTLHPRITITDPTKTQLAQQIHAEASRNCFIAASVGFPVLHEPVVTVAAG
ncbi:OsmC family protein [Aeromicrobium sp. Sec7.5]|uniref:OsmC family protein n=1 Tax=Aeromicrobium sp. Sec7.5 TaxID=3121276 RepID=UPI002FE4DE1D